MKMYYDGIDRDLLPIYIMHDISDEYDNLKAMQG